MLRLGIDSLAVPEPDFLGLANLHLRMFHHEPCLHRQLFRQPKIVGVEEREVTTVGHARAEISRRRYTAPRPDDDPSVAPQSPNFFRAPIARTVIDHDQLEVLKTLPQHGLHRLTDHRPAIVGRYDDANGWRHVCLRTAQKGIALTDGKFTEPSTGAD